MDAEPTELELVLDRGAGEGYSARVRVVRPGSDADDRVEVHGLVLDRAALDECEHDPVEHGRRLAGFLFSDAKLRDAFTTARAASPRLRIRLSIGSAAPELHDVHWETLGDPQRPEAPLLHDPQISFSRYLSSFDWRPVRLRPRQRLRALVVVANPSNLADYRLAPIDVAAELARARAGLQDDQGGAIPCTEIVGGPQPTGGRSMLERMVEALREDHDILYVVCHGALDATGRSNLFLEGADGRAAVVSGAQLAQKLLEVEERPRLVVLVSCQSAGDSEPGPERRALVALGPQLAEAGIPAVVAMRGNLSLAAAERFMPAFFGSLASDGIIDRALTAGRSAVTSRAQASRPVLFMRLRRGRIWYDAGFAAGDDLPSWGGLRKRIEKGQCTPVLGSGLLETQIEYRSWLARRWAKQHGFPLVPSQREDLTAVAQYLAATNYPTFPHEQLVDDLAGVVRERLGADAPKGGVGPLLSALSARRSQVRGNPHGILAALPVPVYLTFCPDGLLRETLAATQVVLEPGAEPVVRRPRSGALVWKRELHDLEPALPNPWEEDPDYEPSVAEPLVYHLFGTFDSPASLVLTQDDYFDFLLNIQKPEVHDDIPGVVRKRLTNSSLLFLGFPLDSWEFRAVFRTILQQGGGLSLATRPHVAAQVEPEEGRVLDPVAARALMHSAFKQAQVDVYFGTVERFLVDLEQHVKRGDA